MTMFAMPVVRKPHAFARGFAARAYPAVAIRWPARAPIMSAASAV